MLSDEDLHTILIKMKTKHCKHSFNNLIILKKNKFSNLLNLSEEVLMYAQTLYQKQVCSYGFALE